MLIYGFVPLSKQLPIQYKENTLVKSYCTQEQLYENTSRAFLPCSIRYPFLILVLPADRAVNLLPKIQQFQFLKKNQEVLSDISSPSSTSMKGEAYLIAGPGEASDISPTLPSTSKALPLPAQLRSSLLATAELSFMSRRASSSMLSLICATTSVIAGRSLEACSLQRSARSATFHTELRSQSPPMLESMMLSMLPWSRFWCTHSPMWMLTLSFIGTTGGWPVMSSRRTTPKLQTSLFSLIW